VGDGTGPLEFLGHTSGVDEVKVLITGHAGYIGAVLVPLVRDAGHEVVGLDNGLFASCTFGDEPPAVPELVMDVRDVTADHLRGFDAVMHLAGLSNDPLGDFAPHATYGINHLASVELARQAKAAGVPRFLFSSSCSNYGAAADAPLEEDAAFNPVTPYGESKVRAEKDIGALADDDFSPTFLRNATAYGMSARLRGDLVVNNLTGYAYTTGQVLLKSAGTSWRPLVHIEDISRAFLAIMEAPRESVHNEAFNVGRTDENYRIRDVAELVAEIVPDSRVEFAEGASPDTRNYNVNCDKIRRVVPAFEPTWTVAAGIRELYDAYQRYELDYEEFMSPRFLRVKHVLALRDAGKLDDDLRVVGGVQSDVVP